MAANYHRPKPVDPIAYRRGCFLNISCGCGRVASVEVVAFAKRNRLPLHLCFYQLIARLRCTKCGSRPRFADVSRDRQHRTF